MNLFSSSVTSLNNMAVWRIILLLICFSEFGMISFAQQRCITMNTLIQDYKQYSSQIGVVNRQLKISRLGYLNQQQKWKIGSKLDVSLPYSKSIESIIQPDGNLLYSQREFMNPLVNASVYKKIAQTGGEIGLSGSLGYFQNFLKSNRQFNVNWFNFYIDQPIFSFNEYRYEQRLNSMQLETNRIQYGVNTEESLKNFVDKVLSVELLKRKLENANKTLLQEKAQLQQLKLLCVNGKILSNDTLLFSHSLQKKELEIELSSWAISIRELEVKFLSGNKENREFCDLLEMENYILDTSILSRKYIDCNYSIQLNMDSFKVNEALRRASMSHGINTTIGAGIGANQTSQQFNQLFSTPSQRQNITIGTTIPLTGWQNIKREKVIAQLEKAIFDEKVQEFYFEATNWVRSIVNEYNSLLRQIKLASSTIGSYRSLAEIVMDKVLQGKASITEYNTIQNQLQELNTEQGELIKKYVMLRFEIRSKCLFDIVENRAVHME